MATTDKPAPNPAPAHVKSAARFADILEFVAESPKAPTFPDIATGLGLPKSSLFHLLTTLVERGYLQQAEERGGYLLGPAIGRLATRMARAPSCAGRAQPVLEELARVLNETCGYYEVHGDEVEVIKTVSGRQLLAYSMRVGDRAPLYCVSAGKALLAEMTPEQVDAYFQRTRLREYTPHTITDARVLVQQVDKARQTGFGYSMQEHSLGIVGLATVVRTGGVAVGAINVALPSVRFNAESEALIRRELARAASAVERSL